MRNPDVLFNKVMCPYCGNLFDWCELIPNHYEEDEILRGGCPGSLQNPRNPESDHRPLWNGKRNIYAW